MSADATPDNLGHVLDMAGATVAADMSRANRFDEKARGIATLAGTWFAVTQAVSSLALTPHTKHGWVLALLAGLALQAVALFMLLVRAASVWKLRERDEVGPETLDAMLRDVTEPADVFASQAVGFYRGVVKSTQEANQSRAGCFNKAMWWWWPVLVVGLLEVATALASRL